MEGTSGETEAYDIWAFPDQVRCRGLLTPAGYLTFVMMTEDIGREV